MPDDLSTRPAHLAELGPVLGELVHDLANELQILHGWALLARGESGAGRRPGAEIDRVVALSGGLGRMLRDVMESVAGEGLSPEVTFDPVELTEALLNDRSRELASLELRFTTRVPVGTRVWGRATFWTRAVANLVGNAARHARRALAVELGWETDGERDWVVARVEDDGPGIPADERALVFRPLWKGSQGHTGLGLGAALWLARQLGGTLRYAEGSRLGGAAFELRVPVADRVGVRGPAAGPAADALAGLRLLVIDDDPAVRTALGRLLRRVGAEVRELDPRGEPMEWVMEAVLRARPDVLVVDLHLGERGGVALWGELCEKIPSLRGRAVFVTGALPGDPHWELARLTGQPVLPKPFDLERLLSVLRELRDAG